MTTADTTGHRGPLLDPALRDFVGSGVSIGVATCDASLRPHTVRAVGARVDGTRLVVFVPRAQAGAVLEDVAANGRIAVVFSQPSTHRTYQLKGRDAVATPERDAERVRGYQDAFADELAGIGFAREYTAALLEGVDDELVGLAFTPEAAFVSTPGPQAGAAIGDGTR
jgi:hypothetical protein